MKKEIIKCDKCNRVIDTICENEAQKDTRESLFYYTFTKNIVYGWVQPINERIGARHVWHLCHECFQAIGIKKQIK